MNQRMALIIAGALTAFVFVLMTGVGLTVAVKSFATTSPAAVQVPAPVSSAIADQPLLASNAITAQLSPDQAAQIALNVAPNATLARTPELVSFQGTAAYEVSLSQGNVYIDANSGKVLLNNATASAAAPAPIRSGERRGEGTNNQGQGGHDD